MLAVSLYGVFILIIFVRVRFAYAPVLITPLAMLVLHSGYFLILLCVAQNVKEQAIVGALLSAVVVLSVGAFRRTIIMPFDQKYINEQIVESCRMLRIKVEHMEDGVYKLHTKVGITNLLVKSFVYGVSLGTIWTKSLGENDAKIVLLNKLLKKKFASVIPHIIIKTN